MFVQALDRTRRRCLDAALALCESCPDVKTRAEIYEEFGTACYASTAKWRLPAPLPQEQRRAAAFEALGLFEAEAKLMGESSGVEFSTQLSQVQFMLGKCCER